MTRRPTVPPSPAAKPRAVRSARGPGEGKAGKSPKVAAFDGWCLDGAIRPPAAVLAIDAASRTIGYAVLSARLEPIAFGVVRSSSTDEEIRAARLVDGVLAVAREFPGVPVCVEVTKGLRYQLKARSTDIATLARCQGRIYQALLDAGRSVEAVRDVEWISAGGSRPKAERAAVIRLRMPIYARWAADGRDEGHDVADSLGLGLWWLGRLATAGLIARGAGR